MSETKQVDTLALAVVLVAYNNGINRWPVFHGRPYVPCNLALCAVLLVLAGVKGMGRPEIGLGPAQGEGLAAGLALGALASAPLFLALRSPKAAAGVADGRFAGMGRKNLAHRALVRIPLGTALPEELAFRGVLYGLLAPSGAVQATLWSSLAFGLWHITPTYNRLEENGRVAGTSWPAVAGLVAAGVVATGLGGLAFCWLRVKSGGIAAPFALHATLNSLGMIAAHRANQRSGRTASRS